jgi:hypothetical protein
MNLSVAYAAVTTTTTSITSTSGVLAFIMALWWIFLLLAIFIIVCQWRIYTKAGKPGWASIVPIYNLIVMMQIIGRPTWWVLLYFVSGIPVIGYIVAFVFNVVVSIDLAKSFGKSTGFGILVAFLPFIGYPMLAFGNAQYVSGSGQGNPNPFSNFSDTPVQSGAQTTATNFEQPSAPVVPQEPVQPTPPTEPPVVEPATEDTSTTPPSF